MGSAQVKKLERPTFNSEVSTLEGMSYSPNNNKRILRPPHKLDIINEEEHNLGGFFNRRTGRDTIYKAEEIEADMLPDKLIHKIRLNPSQAF